MTAPIGQATESGTVVMRVSILVTDLVTGGVDASAFEIPDDYREVDLPGR